MAVNWSAPGNNGGSAITGYTVTLTGGGYNQTKNLGVTTSTTFDSVPYGVSMTASVAAKNSAGTGAAASGSGTSGGVAAPVSVSASALSTSSVRVTFSLSRQIPGTACSVLLNGTPHAVGCTGGDIGGLAMATTYSVVARASGPSGTHDASGGNVQTHLPPAPVANNDGGAAIGSFLWNAGDNTRKCATFPLNTPSILSNDTGTGISAEFVQQNMGNTPGGSELTGFNGATGKFTLCMTRAGANNIGSFVLTYRVVDQYGRRSNNATATVFLVVNN